MKHFLLPPPLFLSTYLNSPLDLSVPTLLLRIILKRKMFLLPFFSRVKEETKLHIWLIMSRRHVERYLTRSRREYYVRWILFTVLYTHKYIEMKSASNKYLSCYIFLHAPRTRYLELSNHFWRKCWR